MQNKTTYVKHLGLIDYERSLEKQKEVFQNTVDIKLRNRKEGLNDPTSNFLLYCEHPHVYTLGKSGDKENLLLNNSELIQKNATFHEIGRGGDITYHGPGQVVGYPILDLDNFFTDIHKYLRLLEESIILTLAEYGLDAGRIDGLTGVWIDYQKQVHPRKICAFGVRASRWVTMHGFALNINPDLSYFKNIVPCGISDKAVTSLEQEIGRKTDLREVEDKISKHLASLFEMELVEE